MTAPKLEQVTDAVIAALEAALPATTGVGDHKRPAGDAYPYVIVYSPITSVEVTRSMSGGVGAMSATLQVSAVGITRKSREITASKVRAALLDPTLDLTTTDVRVSNVALSSGNIGDDPDLNVWREDVRVSLWASAR